MTLAAIILGSLSGLTIALLTLAVVDAIGTPKRSVMRDKPVSKVRY